MKIEQSDVELETFWAKESVFFKSKSLGYICKYLERWYNVKINVDPKIAESQFYTFTVKDDSRGGMQPKTSPITKNKRSILLLELSINTAKNGNER